MQIINEIQNYIANNEIESAYNIIIQTEKEYINNSQYWNLRGVLCSKIQEHKLAIKCYKRAIDIQNDFIDGYFNLIYTYLLIGEKIKATLYAGIAFRYIDDNGFINDIKSLYKNEVLSNEYFKILEEIQSSNLINKDTLNLFKYISYQFKNMDNSYIELLSKNKIADNWAYVKDNLIITSTEIVQIDYFINESKYSKFDIIIPYDINYINVTRKLAKYQIKKCYILVPYNSIFELIEIDDELLRGLKNEDYKRTITLNQFNSADANVYALIKYMPNEYKAKYKLNIIKGREVFEISNIVIVPLISNITISGFNTFVNYPKYTYNIDVGHGSVIMKNCGIMDKKYKNFAFTPQEYQKIDKVFIASKMNMIIQSAFSAIPENKYEITGNPRTDTLLLANGRKNLEILLGKSIGGKKIVFNMPTFHIHENSGIINGTNFNDSFKINEFNYDKFNKFLIENNIICISKVHHAEERVITEKVKNKKLDNLIFISNKDLEEKNLDLYEILNCADGLITDYSSIYGDFLFMSKPIVFINADIEEYRKERGLSLEPYDFWTAGPKVKIQEDLENELLKSLLDEDYYKKKREELRDVFYKFKDSNSTLRVWNHIDKVVKIMTKEELGV